ncbi:MAG: hypothetical protein RIS94_2667 [Pseudomonadota bacterium]
MTVRTATALALLSLATACATPQPAPIIAGGWADAAVADTGITEAARFAAAQLGAPLAEVVAARTQVVAGTNYDLDLRLTDGRHIRATVWRRLDGTFALTDQAVLAR